LRGETKYSAARGFRVRVRPHLGKLELRAAVRILSRGRRTVPAAYPSRSGGRAHGLISTAGGSEAADRLDGLRRHAERIWGEILAGSSDDRITQQSRELQDEIFDHRRRNPLIFDWVYNLLGTVRKTK